MNTIADKPATMEELRKERLIAACIEDRRRLHRLFTPPPPPEPEEMAPSNSPIDLIADLLRMAGSIPGPVGRWARRVSFGSSIFKFFASFARKSR